MPELPQYSAGGGTPPTELRPNEAGVAATAQAGWRVGRAFDQMGTDLGKSLTQGGEDYQKHVTTAQMIKMMPILAEMRAQHTDAWNTIISQPDFDPTDPTTRPKYIAKISQDYAQLAQGMTTDGGVEWLKGQESQELETANTHTMGDLASLTGAYAERSMVMTQRTAQSTVRMDPSKLNSELAAVDSNAQALVAQYKLSPDAQKGVFAQAIENKGDLTYNAYDQAYLNAQDPAAVDAVTAHLAADGAHDYLSNDQQRELADLPEQRKNDIAKDQDHAENEQIKQNKIAFDAALAKATPVISQGKDGSWHVAPAPNFASQIGALRSMPGADASAIRELQDAVVTASRQEADGTDNLRDASTYNWFSAHPGQFTKTDVDTAFNKHQITREDWGTFRDEAKDSTNADSELNKAYAYLNTYTSKYAQAFGLAAMADDDNAPPTGDSEQQLRFGAFVYEERKLLRQVMAANPGKDWHAAADAMFDPKTIGPVINSFKNGPLASISQGWDAGIATGTGTAPVQPSTVAPPAAGQSRADYITRLAHGQ